ncbi:MAG TPA: hypothetical protein VIK14_03155 [Ignavibacteria bacterium]
MDRDYVINEQVKQFFRKILRLERIPNGHLTFKQELETELLLFYDSVDKLTFLYGVHKLIDERLKDHDLTCPSKGNPENCFVHSFDTKALFFTEQEIGQLNPAYDFTFLRPNLNSNLLKDNLIQLRDYPDSAELYQAALNKLNENKNERNILDDLRLSLEILLKKLLCNDKSLENQINDIGLYVKDKGVSLEVRNMFTTLLVYYTKYQNNYVKHNDLVKRDEIDLIVNLTGAFISFLINK